MIEQAAIIEEGIKGPSPMAAEQRTDPRFTLLIRPAKFNCELGEFVCVVRDISASGVSVRTFHPLPIGGEMWIELQHGTIHPVSCIWNKDREAGFEFIDRVDVRAMVSAVGRFPKRQMRIDVDIPVQIAITHTIREPAMVLNLSQQGARIETRQRLSIGQRIHMNAKNLPDVSALVRWRNNDEYGLVFDTTFTLEEFGLLVAKIQSPSLVTTGF